MNEMKPMIPDEIVMNKIYFIRNQKVMLDRDLAALYNIETRVLKQSVRRNILRFPIDFMFELTKTELEIWRSQFVTSNSEKMGLRYAPMAFTEHGVLMLSSIINSDKAIQTNIQIMRIFTNIRTLLIDTTELRLDIEQLKRKTDNQSKNIELVFKYLDELLEKKENPDKRVKIGYKK